jgi:agmatine/peptidylarginine deiminase
MSRRLTAEWEPQSAGMLTWPHAPSDWAEDLEAASAALAVIGASISQDQRLLSICESNDHLANVRALLLRAGAVADRLGFAIVSSDDAWARDHGPIIVLDDDRPLIVDFEFNGWGGKFEASRDNAISRTLHAQGIFGPTPIESPGWVFEGGALETDGQGTLLATRSSMIGPSRNPGLDEAAVERELARLLGMERFLWLDHGALGGDDTDGHIDTLARFADAETILYSSAPIGHPDHEALSAMADELRGLRTAQGHPYRLLALPSPGEIRDGNGRLLPASYANFLITNHSVLLPTYGVGAADAQAQQCLVKAFPGRRVVPIDCRAIVRQNGSLHCLTMQFPAALGLFVNDPPLYAV